MRGTHSLSLWSVRLTATRFSVPVSSSGSSARPLVRSFCNFTKDRSDARSASRQPHYAWYRPAAGLRQGVRKAIGNRRTLCSPPLGSPKGQKRLHRLGSRLHRLSIQRENLSIERENFCRYIGGSVQRTTTTSPYFTAFTMSKIGRYIATTIPPTTTPRNTIMIGSNSDSSALTAVSTSSS